MKGVLKNFAKFTGKHLRPKACNFIKKESLAQMFSCNIFATKSPSKMFDYAR